MRLFYQTKTNTTAAGGTSPDHGRKRYEHFRGELDLGKYAQIINPTGRNIYSGCVECAACGGLTRNQNYLNKYKINNVSNLDTGQFDLSFNSSVLKVVNVEDGDIQGTGIPIQWHLIDIDTLRMIFNLEGVNGITGSGQLAIIEFEVIGHGDTTLYISSQITSFKFLSLLWSSPFTIHPTGLGFNR